MNLAALEGRWEDAIRLLEQTCPYPEITGRICPALCEGSCCNAVDSDAVAIRQIEREIADRAFANGFMKPRTRAERRRWLPPAYNSRTPRPTAQPASGIGFVRARELRLPPSIRRSEISSRASAAAISFSTRRV